jgi:mannose-6-phosphate isomerase-like protein (cupin superfamily)
MRRSEPVAAPERDPRKPVVLRPSEIPAVERGGGARTTPLVTKATGTTKFLNGITSFGPNAAIPLHCHDCEESVFVIEGSALFEIDGVETALGPHDTTWIPPGVPHRFRNPSTTDGLKIFWTYASPDATRTLMATGETRAIAAEHAGGAHAGR